MSTIASPRPSVSLSSRRTSNSTDDTARRSVSTTRAAPATGSVRRNRAALREFYNLKAANAPGPSQNGDGSVPATPTLPSHLPEQEDSELDKQGFDAQDYVHTLLSTSSLETVLRTEASLVAEIRGLDGERKALVYDNYSKLIAATETIRKMRTNMDPLTPTTATLEPAVGHIAEVAVALSQGLKEVNGHGGPGDGRREQRQTVRWALGTPERLRKMLAEGREEDAQADWKEIKALLDKWDGVKGVAELKGKCESLLGAGNAP